MFSWIFPIYCVVCKKEGALLCFDCLDKFIKAPRAARCVLCDASQPRGQCCRTHRNDTHYRDLLTVFRYDTEVIRKVMKGFKYKSGLALARILARPMADFVEKCYRIERKCIVVPLPSPGKRVAVRGYAPTVLLARTVARFLQVPMLPLLHCVRNPLKQASLDKMQRAKNMDHVFALRYGVDLTGYQVILVDDVITTGSTLRAAAKVLYESARPRELIGLTFAQNS